METCNDKYIPWVPDLLQTAFHAPALRKAVLLEKGVASLGRGVAVREGFLKEVASEP